MRWLIAVAVVAGCGEDAIDKTAACDLTSERVAAATVQDRKVIGVAAPYAADLGMATREAEFAKSIAARRAAAWQVVERVLAPVPLAEPKLAPAFGGQPTVPAWHTWYARDDYERLFKHLYRDLGPAGRKARAPIDAAAGFAWNANALDEDPAWPEQRYLDYLATIDTQAEADGVPGASRVAYSPGATKHLLEHYEALHQCRLVPAPPAFDADELREGQRVVETDRMAIEQCGWRVLGPFQAGAGDVKVTSSGSGDIDLYVRRGEAPTPSDYDCKAADSDSAESCVVDGNGSIYVAVFGAAAAEAEVDIEYTTADVALPKCLGEAMPRDAVIVKSDWRRQLPGETLPTYDSTAARMATRLGGDATWNADGAADPAPSDIYTVELPATQQRFRMVGLHMMTKELDHWMWITLWYSKTPDDDFGADRPASIAALPGPWKNYKMCVSTGYVEGDPDPRGGASGSLGDALAAVHGGVGAPTWCSNPYLEQGKGNAATNCIGCHQHGGTDLMAEAILEQPAHGATRVRNNFFTDYSWAVKGGNGDDLSSILQAEIDYWDANDP